MTANKQILFTTEFLHQYYTNGKCPDLEVTPAFATARIMEGQWLSMHSFENGFRLAYSPEKLSDPQDPGFKYEKLHFLLKVKNTGFFQFTDINWQDGYLFYYSFDPAGQLETSQVKLFGQLFNYHFSVAQIALTTVKIINDAEIQVYEQQFDITENDNDIQIDLRNHPGGPYHIQLLQNDIPVYEEKIVIDAGLLRKNNLGILEIPGISPADPSPLFEISFENTESTWKYYIITQKEEYPQHKLLLKDKEDIQSNRYSGIDFEFAERPVEIALNGERIFLYETGTINDQNEFVPQLIPAFEENKKELYLIDYECHNGPGNNPIFYLFHKCIKEELWDNVEKKHIIPEGYDPYHEIKLKKNNKYTVLRNLQNPPMTKLNKEVFIYL